MRVTALLVCLAAGAAFCQDPQAAMEQSVRKQRESVEKQRSAVQAQFSGAAGQSDSFFTIPWTQPLTLAAPAPLPAPAPLAPAADCGPVPPEKIDPLLAEISQQEGLTPDLLRAVIEKESSYLPCAVSSKGAQGLMQLMPSTAADLGVENPFDPRENVDAGARFLKQLLVRYEGDLPLALAAYNAGPGRVDSAGGIPPIPETLNYVSGILGRIRSR
ncbi:MAG: lytic transglycosylase domain-containing protein [Bryobacteraceae bacterium]|jgi:soluble lytic murein transglycosylase-like protein